VSGAPGDFSLRLHSSQGEKLLKLVLVRDALSQTELTQNATGDTDGDERALTHAERRKELLPKLLPRTSPFQASTFYRTPFLSTCLFPLEHKRKS